MSEIPSNALFYQGTVELLTHTMCRRNSNGFPILKREKIVMRQACLIAYTGLLCLLSFVHMVFFRRQISANPIKNHLFNLINATSINLFFSTGVIESKTPEFVIYTATAIVSAVSLYLSPFTFISQLTIQLVGNFLFSGDLVNKTNVNQKNDYQKTVLHEKAHNGSKKDISFLIDCGADINATDSYGRTPLHLAAINGNTKAMQLLLENGADVNATESCYQKTPLHLAVQFAQADFFALLPNEIIKLPKTRVIELLLKNGANVNATSYNQSTPLHFAIEWAETDVIELLLNNKADIRLTNNDGKTPFHLAIQSGKIEVIQLFLDSGADVNQINHDKSLPHPTMITPFLNAIRAELKALDEIKYHRKPYPNLSLADVANKMGPRDQLFCIIPRNREMMERVRYLGFVDDYPILGRCVLYKLEQGALKLGYLSLATQKMMSDPFKESYFNKLPAEVIEEILKRVDINQLKEIANMGRGE